jgi:hypothetical protein
MKRTFTLLSLLAVLFGGAQPVIQYSNTIMPPTALTATVFMGNKPSSPGASGTNVTWNFSSLSFTQFATVSIVSPTATPYASSFSSANVASAITGTFGTVYAYNNIQPTFQDQIGDGISAAGGATYTPDPKRHLVFPFNYGNSYSDSYQCVSCSPGSFTVTYDAYGTLMINGKTYYNVARISNLFGFPYYNYYNTNPVFPIFSYDTSPSSGSSSTLVELTGAGIGMTENFVTEHMVTFPNPANGELNVRNTSFMQIEFEIYDLLGKLVKEKELLKQGEITKTDISSYTPGLYFIKYHDEFGNDTYSKLIIE